MKKHFKKLIDFLLFGIPLFVRVLLEMKNQNNFPYINNKDKETETKIVQKKEEEHDQTNR